MRSIFVLAAGQYDNVGDTMHRRVLLDWLRPMGRLHIYVGAAPPSFISGLGLESGDQLHRSLGAWTRALLTCDAGAVLAFNPGEVTLSSRRALREAGLLPLVMLIKARHGHVWRIGIAAGDNWKFSNRVARWALTLAVTRSTMVKWREQRSRELFGTGTVIPDLAFALGGSVLRQPPDSGARDLLVVTMRCDRPMPSAAWTQAVRDVAVEASLQIVVVAQVRRDNRRSAELGSALDADVQPWLDQLHEEHEASLRRLYARTVIVVSDRLHALIAASTEGAVPVALLTAPADKIAVHFDAVDVSGVAMDTSTRSRSDVVEFIVGAMGRADATQAKVSAAKARLDATRDELQAALRSGRPRRGGLRSTRRSLS